MTTLYLIVGLCIVGTAAIYLLKIFSRWRGDRLAKLDHWTRKFYKDLDDVLTYKDVSLVLDLIEVMNDSVASPRTALTWIRAFSKPREDIKRTAGPAWAQFKEASPELQCAAKQCVIAGILALSYRSMVSGFVLRALMADALAEPSRAVEFATEPDLRSRVRHLPPECLPA